MTELDDNQLVARVIQGEEWAFLALYDRYVGGVWYVLSAAGDKVTTP